jgi:hypothetical protein
MLSTFPRFTPITLDHKEDYDRLVSAYPPLSDISFATLNIWWNLEGNLQLCELNGNLVIDYHLPFDADNSGYSIIGKHLLNDSIDTIFYYLEQEKKPVRLVHVPEFVINEIGVRDPYTFTEELDYNEYILDSKGLASLEDAIHGRTRRKIKRFLRETEEREVEFRELDLSSETERRELFEAIVAWEKEQSSGNDPDRTEHQAIQKTLSHAEHFGIRHIGLYVDGKLHAVILYHLSHDSNYYILHHLKVDYSIPYIFDYMTHHIASKAVKEGVDFLNMEMDLGIESLRQHKMGLRPVDFFRKYTVTPAGDA